MRHFFQCRSRSTVRRKAPFAVKIIKVCGGFYAFESIDDFYLWKRQK